MPISTNTTIDYTNKIIDLTGVDSSTPYGLLVLYSYSKEDFKLSANADDDFAWDAPTPFDLTLKNGWYLRRHSIPRLQGGTITTNYGTDEIGMYELQAGGTNFVEGDIGRTVRNATQAVNFGTLVDFDNADNKIWVRVGGSQHNAAASDVLEVTTAGGTGSRSSTGVESYGDDQWAGIQTIGDLVLTGPQPLMYVYTGNPATGDLAGNARRNEGNEDDFDEELTGADRGPLTVLVAIRRSGTLLGNPAGEIHVYARQGLDNYSDFAIDVSAGGLVSIPISNANDVEDTIGSYCFAVDGQSATDFTPGEEITEDTAVPAWKAEVVEYIEGVDNSTSVLIVRGLTALPSDNDTFTGTSSGATGVVRGTAGGQLVTYDVETDGIIEGEYGNTLTGSISGAQSVLRGHLTIAEGGGSVGYAILESNHDVEADGDFYLDIVDNDVLTGTGVNVTADVAGGRYDRLASDLDDVRIKPAFQRLTGITAGDAVRGDNITQATSGATGTIVEVVSASEIHVSSNNGIPFDTTNTISDDDGGTLSGTPTTAPRDRVFDYALPLQSTFEYNIMIEGAGRTNDQIYAYIKHFQEARSTGTFLSSTDQARELYLTKEELGAGTQILQKFEGEEYFRAYTDEDTPSNNPTGQDAKSRLAVKNGSTIVTGQGVALINVAGADANNITLRDAAGVQHSPFTSVTITITNAFVGAHIVLSLDDGSGQEDTSQFISDAAANVAGDADFVITTAIPNDTPLSGTVRIIDTGITSPENRELRFRYASWTGSTFTFVSGDSGTATAGSSGNILEDTGAFPGSIEVGDPIRNTTDGSFGWVKEIIDANTIRTSQLEGGTSNDWVTGDSWDTMLLPNSLTSADTAYVPYMDIIVDTVTETQNLTFVTNRNIIGVHREETLLDVVIQGTITSTGFSFRVPQTVDDKYTPT